MTKEQTRQAMEECVKACYFGATRRTRLQWVITNRLGYKHVQEAATLVALMIRSRLLEDHHSWGWVSSTPFLISILDNWDALTQDITWSDDVTTDDDAGGQADETASQDNG